MNGLLKESNAHPRSKKKLARLLGRTGRASLILMVFTVERAAATDFDGAFATTNDFGDVGLLQTPSARMRADGEFGAGISTVRPYNQIHLFLQPLPWLETAVRYTDITNRRYGPQSFSGNQSYKDKSADLKLRLVPEGVYWPAIAVGIQDFGGTGIFSGEYLVGSYHYFDLDFSLGLGWGRVGSRGGIKNPFTWASNHFDRERSNGGAGSSGFSNVFTGTDIGPFGGVQWNTPLKGLSLQVEYDGNNYQHEGLGNKLPQSTPINVALNYRGLSGVDVGLGYERGRMLMARVSMHFNFQNFLGIAKLDDPPPLPVRAQPDQASMNTNDTAAAGTTNTVQAEQPSVSSPGAVGTDPIPSAPRLKLVESLSGKRALPLRHQDITEAEKSAFVLQLKAKLHTQQFELAAVNFVAPGEEVQIWLSRKRFRNPAKATGRIARILSGLAPEQIQKFTIINMESGLETYRVTILREPFEKVARHEANPEVLSQAITLTAPENAIGSAAYLDTTQYPAFTWDIGPALRQYVGGPDSFYIAQVYGKLEGTVNFTEHLSLSAAGGVNIYNNFNKLKQQSNSLLPHVRSDVVNYLKKGQNDLIKLEANYIWSPAPDIYARLSGGIFEEMYGGIGAEVLYRPYGSPIAVGLDINRVVQRGYDQLLDFRDYSVTTGHLTMYYHLPFYNLLAKVSVGRYLARDKGATLDLSREFASGIRAGIFATKTNVSAAQFGEGRFDKGLYLSIPLDLFFTQSSRNTANLLFRPLTRDGGQKVRDGEELYPIVKGGQPEDFAAGWGELFR